MEQNLVMADTNKYLEGIYNYTTPDWAPLERAAAIVAAHNVEAGDPAELVHAFMWMCEEPKGLHQYKHSATRNYAMLRADSTADECRQQIARAVSFEPTWGRTILRGRQ